MTRALPLAPLAAALLAAPLAAQAQAPPAFPQRDILSPFRPCNDIYAPPDAVFLQLRLMRDQSEQPGAAVAFDQDGREVVDHPVWRRAREELGRLQLDAGYLAEIMRRSRNADERDLAFYGAFFAGEPAHVLNLISHIPGEPERRTREKAYPRAIAWLRAHLGRRWGDLSKEQQQALGMPEPGSPAAKAMGITRKPTDEDFLFRIHLVPFFQLLDLQDGRDQAQGLWFLKECFLLRKDLAQAWLEPALPRLRELLASSDAEVREQAIGLLAAIAPPRLKAPLPTAATAELLAWMEAATKAVFPPIRVVSEALVLLYPGPERDALVLAGIEALQGEGLGDPASGRTEAGQPFWGFRLTHVPEALQVLQLPRGAILTTVNGKVVRSAKELLATVTEQLAASGRPRTLLVEYVHQQKPKAVEYRIL